MKRQYVTTTTRQHAAKRQSNDHASCTGLSLHLVRVAHLIAVFCVCSALFALPPAHAADDPVGSYLDELGLKELLALHLEERLEGAAGEEREAILMELAELYTALLATEDDPQRRESIERRSRALIEHAPEDGAAELRLALLRGAFQSAERIAERHRLRLASNDEVSQAMEQLDEIIPQFRDVQRALERRIRALSQRGGGEEQHAWMRQRIAQVQQLEAQSRFLNAWALYYRAYLRSNDSERGAIRDDAEVAQRLFAELLRLDSAHAQPGDVSLDLRDTEPFARSILGMALCRSLTQSMRTALNWLELLEHEQTHRKVREEVPGWKLAVRLEHDDFPGAHQLLEERAELDTEIPLSWLRLAAVHALNADRVDGPRDALIVFAVARIATRGDLRQVLDLAETYGIDSLGQTGFAHDYIRGVLLYREARDAHGNDDVAADESVREMYRDAARALRAAIDHRDADDFPDAVASSKWLLGWSRFYRSEYRESAEWFTQASEALAEAQAAESLWMAIVALDRLSRESTDPSIGRQHATLTNRYLRAYPDSPRASQLRINQAAERNDLSDDELRELLSTPADQPGAGRARRVAAQALYHRFRAAEGEDRALTGAAFLDIASSLLREPRMFEDIARDDRPDRLMLLARQVLEVALAGDIEQHRPARLALDVIDALALDGAIDLLPLKDELTYRRLRYARLRGECSESVQSAETLWQRDSRSIWARQAARTIFQLAHTNWQAQHRAGEEPSLDLLALVARHGGRVLREFEDDPNWHRQPHLVQVHAAVAEASMELWQRTDDSSRAQAALFLYRRLLEHQPRQTIYLRNAGTLAEHLRQYDYALHCWRTIASGSARGEAQWYEARYHVMAILAEADPQRAQQVLAQHRQLDPEYGPEPWRTRFRALERELAERLDNSAEGAS